MSCVSNGYAIVLAGATRGCNMPIPRELFERDVDPEDQKIPDILKADPDQAYSMEDLAKELGYSQENIHRYIGFALRLDDPGKRGILDSTNIHGKPYYAAPKKAQV